MELDALKSSAAIAWGWLWHVTTADDRVKTARHLLGQMLDKDLKRYGIQTAKAEGAQVNVQEIEAAMLAEQAKGYSSRMTAGYCWPWSDPLPDGTLIDDVSIDSWSRPWNLKGDRAIGGAPPSALWATDPSGFGQVGCVYTAQGFEYDWNGVIMGPDLVWRGDRWVAQRLESKDPDFRSVKRVPPEEFDRLLRNVYKVLLTRGMVGTVVFSTDAETRRKLAELIGT